MSRTDQPKPAGKQSRRNRKPEQRNKEPDQKMSATRDQEQEVNDEISATEPSDAAAVRAAPSDPAPVSFLDQQQDPTEHIGATAEPSNAAAVGAATASNPLPVSLRHEPQDANERVGALVEPTDIALRGAAPDIVPISFQAIATAYGDYSRKSLEQTRFFVERLARVRSLDKAVEVQIEFAKQAYETFVTEMQRICVLQSQLARQSLKPLERFAARSDREAR